MSMVIGLVPEWANGKFNLTQVETRFLFAPSEIICNSFRLRIFCLKYTHYSMKTV
jgi:hypothetical protein